MTYAQLDEAINDDLGRDLLKRAVAAQEATIGRLETAGRQVGAVVDAGALDVVAQEHCANNPAHGLGTCVFPETDGLCPACTADYIQQCHVAGDHLAIDVLL